MSDQLNSVVLANAAQDIKKLSAWFAGLAALGPELSKITSIEGAIRESQARLDAARAEEEALKARVAQEIQQQRDAANADAEATRDNARNDAHLTRTRAHADAEAITETAQKKHADALENIAALHEEADSEIAAKHKAAGEEIAARRSESMDALLAEVNETKQHLTDLRAEIAKVLASPLVDQARRLAQD